MDGRNCCAGINLSPYALSSAQFPDCFHVATAVVLNCSALYTTDKDMLSKQERLSIRGMQFLEPLPRKPELFPEDPDIRLQ
jgi:hypothetical protein